MNCVIPWRRCVWQLITSGENRKNPELEKNLENIEIKIKDSEQIINDLLFYSRLKLPTLKMINLFEILKENIVNLKSRYPKHHIKINQDFDGLQDILVEADPLQLGELFGNILNNACEAVDPQSGEIEVIGVVDAGNIKLTIQDNGIGINPEDAKKVFEPFFSTKAKGTGLGLAVCNQIVSLHNGSIAIKNGQDKGAVVSIVFTFKERKKWLSGFYLLMTTMKFCEELSEILKHEGFDTEYCLFPEQGIELLKSNKYEILLLDFKMPRVNGVEFLKKYQEELKGLKIFMITGSLTVNKLLSENNLPAW